ncbi:M20/M25/M40 family metallo-hydrolase [Streptomyces iconiensis]|uniref:M20/M25/M40 family metallo-hydrolase n=1 Tax=Streptomyces iconiensis TaxID=1384038 RepID=A0ABT7A9I0_9ACTN|nr:M20/M25/M40 family metallo-hydrolase [Streptomyces iconiensis]MDJ1138019.1 M20/M25/M40 family metallo-hydrolase [Streptomyces iconiensis]
MTESWPDAAAGGSSREPGTRDPSRAPATREPGTREPATGGPWREPDTHSGEGSVAESVTALAQELVRAPSRGGVDDYGPVLGVLERWLTRRRLAHRRLRDGGGATVGLVVEVPGGEPGPWWVLDACVDTAGFGDEAAWSFAPTCGNVVNGWLRGRGAADSKLAAAAFCHLAAELLPRARDLRGGLAVLLDVDEHTGAFGGARAYLADPLAARPAGVMIGYPGLNEVVVGGRGLWRATLTVYATSGHSGSSGTSLGAVSRAAHLVRLLDAAELPVVDPSAAGGGSGSDGGDDGDGGAWAGKGAPGGGAPGGGGFPLPPKLTVTAVHGGEGFSVTPDRCELNVDVRTTPSFGAYEAEALVRGAVAGLEAELPGPRATRITPAAAWPPFRLRPDEQPAAALLGAARGMGVAVRAKVAGPSNIGNLLAGEGIPATAGFGVRYEGLHGVDERARIDDLPQVYAVYRSALLDLLGAT